MSVSIVTANLPLFGRGFLVTLQLLFASLAAGFALALPLSVALARGDMWVRLPASAYTYVFRGTPMLVQLMLIYYGLGQFEWMRDGWRTGNALLGLFKEPYFCALLAFTLNTCAYTAEILAGGMRNIAHGEVEAARAIGMSSRLLLRRILLPSALRRSLPAYSNEVVLMLHGTAIASTVTLIDLTGAARIVYSRHYAPFEAFLFAGLLYLCLTFVLMAIFRRLELRWLAHLNLPGSR